MGAKVTFQRATCGRCGGSGRYSYNQMDGDRCYGCGGGGQVFTKAGAAARAAFQAKRLELAGVAVAELQPGMRMLMPRGTFATVVRVECDPEHRWASTSGGVTKTGTYTTVHTKTDRGHAYCYPTERVIVANPAVWPALLEFARGLKGATVTEAAPAEVTV